MQTCHSQNMPGPCRNSTWQSHESGIVIFWDLRVGFGFFAEFFFFWGGAAEFCCGFCRWSFFSSVLRMLSLQVAILTLSDRYERLEAPDSIIERILGFLRGPSASGMPTVMVPTCLLMLCFDGCVLETLLKPEVNLPRTCPNSEGNFWGVGAVVLELAFFGAKLLSPSLCRSTFFFSDVPGLRAQSASCCKGNCMAIQTMKPESSLRQCRKEQDGTCPARSNHFWCILSSSGLDCPKLPPPIIFQGPEFQPEKYFRGPEKCDQIHPRPQKEPKNAKSGARKNVFGAREKKPEKWKFCPWGQRTEFPQETLPHNSCQILACIRQWELFSWMFMCAPVWRMCHLSPKSTMRAKSIRSGTCIRCSGICGHGNMDEKKNGADQKMQVPAPTDPIPQLMLS